MRCANVFHRFFWLLCLWGLPGFLHAAPTFAEPSRVIHAEPGLFGEIIVEENRAGLRTLLFQRGGSRQSVVKPDDPQHLELEYLRVALIGLSLARQAPERILVIGLGGGSLPGFLRRHYPGALIEVVEIDPAVLRVAVNHLGFRQDGRLNVHLGDGRAYIERAAPASYDLIVMDAYGSTGMPPHLATLESLRALRAALRSDGVAVSNIWGPDLNRQYHNMLTTQREVFESLRIVYTPNDVNVLVFGLPHPESLTLVQLADRARALGSRLKLPFDLGFYIETASLDADKLSRKGVVLRDPY